MSLMALWRMEGMAPLGQLRAWLTLKGWPHGQCEASLAGVHPNLKHRASLKACLCRLKPYLARGMAVIQEDVPFDHWLAPSPFAWPWAAWASVHQPPLQCQIIVDCVAWL